MINFSRLIVFNNIQVLLKIGQCCEYPLLSVKLKSVIIKKIEELQSINTDSSRSIFQSNENDNDKKLNEMENKMKVFDQY